MKLKTKIIVDKVAGLPLVYLLNVLARILGFVLRIDHSLNKPVKRIAICKFVGMGSIVQSTPLLKTLRKNYPDAQIIFITNASNKPLFNFIKEVDEVYTISDKGAGSLISSSLGLIFRLWKNRPDVYIDLEIYSNYSSVIATMSLAKNRMGFFKDDKTYRKGMYTHMMFFNIKSPVSQTYLQFARLMGCRELNTNVSLNREMLSPESIRMISKKLDLPSLEKYIIINPNASDLRLERRWSAENVIQLIRKISSVYADHKIILIGDKNEAEYVNSIALQLTGINNLLDSSGKLSLPELISLIAGAQLMITNDTGPMHLAFALKIRTVSLFGPCSPQQYGGTDNTVTIYKNVYCSPCIHEFLIPPCKGDNQCMKKIGVEEVENAVQKAMQLIVKEETEAETTIEYTNSNSAPLGVVMR